MSLELVYTAMSRQRRSFATCTDLQLATQARRVATVRRYFGQDALPEGQALQQAENELVEEASEVLQWWHETQNQESPLIEVKPCIFRCPMLADMEQWAVDSPQNNAAIPQSAYLPCHLAFWWTGGYKEKWEAHEKERVTAEAADAARWADCEEAIASRKQAIALAALKNAVLELPEACPVVYQTQWWKGTGASRRFANVRHVRHVLHWTMSAM